MLITCRHIERVQGVCSVLCVLYAICLGDNADDNFYKSLISRNHVVWKIAQQTRVDVGPISIRRL